MRPNRPIPAAGLLVALFLGGCIPYSVGTTAQPVPKGKFVESASLYFVPAGIEPMEDSLYSEASGPPEALAYAAADVEGRLGLDSRSDLGIRIPGGSGVVINYKRRWGASMDTAAAAVASVVGGGVVNFGNHLHLEASLLASGRQSEVLTPYGGVRVMQVMPLNPGAVSDAPTLGVLAGVRIGASDLGISPEIGVFYDPSALGLRESNLLVVPSFTFHGSRLFQLARRFIPLL